eukprot:TRINITY_DN32948_c0_g1_i1.p1 TRINITY_DN32948_c0_g1~~TRINITY_DN32948_c0_g1_i1.p1  ORF type:complete len:499 (-),score=87.27 TRINITY_DN32948_c0_g1_i1:246-1700(-)
MADAININFSGLDGVVGATSVPRYITVAELKCRLEFKLGADSPLYLRLVHGIHVLQDPTVLADAFGSDTNEVELTLIQLKGPEVLDYEHFNRFVAAIEAEEQPTQISFSLESLRVLNLSSKPGLIEQLMCNEFPGSDCVKEIESFSAFLRAMREMQSLTELDLSHNPLNSQVIDPEEEFTDTNPCINLGEALPRTLEVLMLSHSGWWNSEEMEFLASGLARGAPLTHLRELRVARSSRFRFNTSGNMAQISRNLAKGLSKCFSFMPALEKLSLEACSLHHEHLSELSVPQTLRSLNLVRNFCIDEGACSNVEALVAQLPNLEELQLSVSKESDDNEACRSLRNAVPQGCKVQFVENAAVAFVSSSISVPNADLLKGLWTSENGEINIFEDKMTGQLIYTEFIGDGSDCIRGHLKPDGEDTWSGELMLLEEGQEPWYGPSCGEKPETVGEVRIRLLLATDSMQLELCIKATDEDWAAPVLFQSAD